jgi:simple sugar transport system permease protein
MANAEPPKRLGPVVGLVIGLFVVLVFAVVLVPGLRELGADVVGIVDASYVRSALRFTVPIAFAGMGGIFAEKSGVINIGLEGLLIISAFTAIAVMWLLGDQGDAGRMLAMFGGVLASLLVTLLFAIICIEFKADQIIAGLAVWLIALGFAPFGSIIIWGTVNSDSVGSFDPLSIPLLSDLPYVGQVLFRATPPVYLMLLAVPFSWYLLNRTAFGKHLQASGEDPKTLDTAGVSVRKVRYAGVLLSGIYCGIGGAGLALNAGQFVGGGETITSGRGWIGLTTYLIANYNPVGAFLSAFFFAGLDALQLQIQRVPGIELSSTLIGIIPYVAVLIVLTFVGKTRMPASAGEHYESED